MLWFVLSRKLHVSDMPEFKVQQLNSCTIKLAEGNGWRIVYGGFHSRHDADECYHALTCPSNTLSVLAHV
jgi:hypothetical protein